MLNELLSGFKFKLLVNSVVVDFLDSKDFRTKSNLRIVSIHVRVKVFFEALFDEQVLEGSSINVYHLHKVGTCLQLLLLL